MEDLELEENAEIRLKGNTATVKITGSVPDEIWRQTDSQLTKNHNQIGCLLTSAIAFTLWRALKEKTPKAPRNKSFVDEKPDNLTGFHKITIPKAP
jgi:hypothetical protein